jgi:hypothetical protein
LQLARQSPELAVEASKPLERRHAYVDGSTGKSSSLAATRSRCAANSSSRRSGLPSRVEHLRGAHAHAQVAAAASRRLACTDESSLLEPPDCGKAHVRIPRGGDGIATTALAPSASQPAGGHEGANTHATNASGRAALGARRPAHPSRQSCSPTRWNAGHVRRSGNGAGKPTPRSRSASLRSANRRSRRHS